MDVDELSRYRDDFQGLSHVLGFMDAMMIAEHFELVDGGARSPGEWAARGKLLPPPAGAVEDTSVFLVVGANKTVNPAAADSARSY